MDKHQKFFICKHCGNIIGMIKDSGVPIVCCGEKMERLKPNTTEASHEKHLPQISVENNIATVTIGSVPHPMVPEHYIEWVYLLTEKGGQRKNLKAGDEPVLKFALTDDDEVVSAYAYCNIHGLWETTL
ncbi:MAG TPA: desulfoferrodoxin [Ruminococcaceae bacterium]|nr:desulfoferrodoxin [Oscillospiraceae bacterium]